MSPTRKVLISEELAEVLAMRDNDANKITVEWGESDADGWWEPTFTVHHDDNIADDVRDRVLAAARTAVKGLNTDLSDDEGAWVSRAAVLAILAGSPTPEDRT